MTLIELLGIPRVIPSCMLGHSQRLPEIQVFNFFLIFMSWNDWEFQEFQAFWEFSSQGLMQHHG